MSIALRTAFGTIKTIIDTIAGVDAIEIGEPKAPPSAKVHVGLFLRRTEPDGTTLNGSIDKRTILARCYMNMVHEPKEEIEFTLDEVASAITDKLMEDFELTGSGIRNIDPMGFVVEYGYQQVATTLYRIADVYIRVIIDDNADFIA